MDKISTSQFWGRDYVAERGMLKLNPTPASTFIWTQNILQQIIYISEDKLKP